MKVEHLNECFWAQRDNHIAFKKCDYNTVFFHAQVKQRRKKNLIKVLRDKDGELCSGRAFLKAIVVDYFQHLLLHQARRLTNKTCLTLVAEFPWRKVRCY